MFSSAEMFSIRIFDLQKVGRGHNLQRRPIRRWIDFFTYSRVNKNFGFISIRFPLIHHQGISMHIHTRMIAIGENATRCISTKNDTRYAR